jgi:predicted YcjX-like family ATPase
MIMTVEQIEKAILNLSETDFSELRNWLLDLDYQQWDQQLEQNIKNGLLDDIAKEALAEFEAVDYQEI